LPRPRSTSSTTEYFGIVEDYGAMQLMRLSLPLQNRMPMLIHLRKLFMQHACQEVAKIYKYSGSLQESEVISTSPVRVKCKLIVFGTDTLCKNHEALHFALGSFMFIC